ncbi:RHS repeat domain-containing protein, partial [Chryseobacterium sp. MYb328]|uniref:RHS repeat domain-containing protein n=1 Tax=Chryseobacterium sp. MYb328 TaxID=2745231 RepID=UPI0030A2ACD2
IYNYADHLGNVRLSYFKNGTGIEVLEENNYYPFGLKHEGYNGLTGNPNYQYKYNGKELQETGMYDYGARMYMPDLGRWGVVDPLAEISRKFSPYNYAVNNPIRFIDPDGMKPEQFMTMKDLMNDDPPTKNKGASEGGWSSIKNFFRNIFSKNEKSNNITTVAPAATISRPVINVGEIALEGIGSSLSFDAVLGTLGKISLWTLPLTLEGDTSRKEQSITLYRGVSSKAKGSMYFEAVQGIAIPNGFRQIATTWGPHSDMEEHAGGDNLSIWTSWSSSKETAKDFATGVAMYKNGIPGIIMSKKFKITEASPNPFTLGEAEWLVPGVVYGAKVEYVMPRSK